MPSDALPIRLGIGPTSKEVQRSAGALSLPGFVLSRTGLVPEGRPTFDSWQEAGTKLRLVEDAVHWWIGDWLRYGEQTYGEMYTQALEVTQYDYQTLRDAKWVSSKVELSRRRDNVPWSHHREVAPLEPDEQDALLNQAEAEGLTRRDFRERVRAFKQSKAVQLAGPVPEGLYQVLLADPPWRYDFATTPNRQIENHYPTMETEAIKALKVPAADDAVLYLWATAPLVPKSLEVMAAWGFEYKTQAVWDKEIIGMGYWFRGQHEVLLVGTRGTFSPPPESCRVPSVVRGKRAKHSEKPDAVYQLIESAFPEARKIELFSRRARKGWSTWGNEVVPNTSPAEGPEGSTIEFPTGSAPAQPHAGRDCQPAPGLAIRVVARPG
jgi:N6-adenosine-specific RNA methylase IME4